MRVSTRWRLALGLATLWGGTLAQAGVTYTVTQRDLTAATAARPVTYYAQHHAIRVGGLRAQRVIVFKDDAIYSIDHTRRTVEVLQQATLDRVRARLQASRSVQTVTLHFSATDRSEKVGTRTCRVWEEREDTGKSEATARHLEVCIVPAEQLSGGLELADALGELCHYYGGSLAALGVGFGLTDPWPAFTALKGVPIRIREFQQGRAVSETTITDIHAAAVPAAVFDVPRHYRLAHRIVP